MEEIFGEIDIARARGVKPQTIQVERARGKIPAPSFITVGGRPLWRRSTLEKAGVLRTVSTGKSQEGEPDE